MSSTPGPQRRELLVALCAGALPTLATVALLLPSGLLMPARLAMVALFVVAAVDLVRTRRPSATAIGMTAVAGAFGVLGVVGRLRFPATTSWQDYSYLVFLLLACLAMSVLGARAAVLKGLLWGWLVAGLVAAPVGVWEVLTARHLSVNTPGQTVPELRPGWNEISAFFDNPNLYAYQIAVVCLLLPVLWPLLPGRWRWLLAAFGALQAVLLVWTDGRISMLVLAAGLALWSLRYRWSRIAAVAAAGVVGATALLGLPPGRQVLTAAELIVGQTTLEGSSSFVRVQLFRSGAWVLEQTSPLTGAGPGGFEHLAATEANPHRFQELNNAHSGFLEVAVNYGLIGLAVLVAAIAAACVAVLIRTSGAPADAGAAWRRTVAIGAAIQLALLAGASLAHSTWLRQPLTAVHLATLVAMVAYALAKPAGTRDP